MMALTPVDQISGLWRSGDADRPGVHALIIGISDYPYLGGGSAVPALRAPDNGGLGQLEVSALSAALFFKWLSRTKEIGGAPIASCRVHLGPRPDELDRVKALVDGPFGGADFATLRAAIDAWCDEMAIGGRVAGTDNVALFFYSGHGVEVSASPALLASDVLYQGAADRGVGKAFAIDSLATAVRTYNINRGLLFIDACRDAPLAARILHLTGEGTRRPNDVPQRRPDALIRLQSTASGLKSYQVKDEVGTLFTQAVLDGLEGHPPQYAPYDISQLPWPLRFSALEGHVKRKVSALLADHSPLAVQSVEPYGTPYNGEMIVALKDGPPPDAGDLPPGPVEVPLAVEQAVAASAAKVLRNATFVGSDILGDIRAKANVGGNDLSNFDIMHAILGHESVTYPWLDSLRYLDARTGEAADPGTIKIEASRSQEIDDRIVAWLDFTVAPNGGGGALWIGAGGREGELDAAVVIPSDFIHPLPARLDIMFNRGEQGWALSQMSARIADPNEFNIKLPPSWTALFEAQRTAAFADLGSAARSIERLVDLEEVVEGKRDSPIAAAFATNLLLRTGGLDWLKDWPRNLAEWFPWLADGAVLWGETLLQREGDFAIDSADPRAQAQHLIETAPRREALRYFSLLAERGVPVLGHSLILALRQAAMWRLVADSHILSAAEQTTLLQALDYVERAGRYAASGAGYTRYQGAAGAISPETVLGVRRPRARPMMMTA